MHSEAATVSEYLSLLSPEERADIQKVRGVIRKNLPKGYRESVQWGMICYSIPLSRYSEAHNGQARGTRSATKAAKKTTKKKAAKNDERAGSPVSRRQVHASRRE